MRAMRARGAAHEGCRGATRAWCRDWFRYGTITLQHHCYYYYDYYDYYDYV
jgi:hypothetical protein